MNTDGPSLKYAIVEYTTNKNFCNVYDALGIERLEWEVVAYDREKRVHIERANAYLSVARCKLLIHQVLNGIAQQAGWKLEVFGGSEREDGIESRFFKIEYDPGQDNRFARFPFRINIAVGPGKRTATNGIAPDGKPHTQVNMRFPDDDFTTICLELRDHLLVHQRDLEQVRRDEQHRRFAHRRPHPTETESSYAA